MIWGVTRVIFGTTTILTSLIYCNYKPVRTISTRIHPVGGHFTGTCEAKPRTNRVTKMEDNIHVSKAGGVADLSRATA